MKNIVFDKILKLTEKLILNEKKSLKILDKIKDKLDNAKDNLRDTKDKLKIVRYLVVDWIKGNYKEVPKRTIIYFFGALIYFLIPTDLIPDFLFQIGLLDDIAVIHFVLEAFSEDIKKYEEFKKQKKEL